MKRENLHALAVGGQATTTRPFYYGDDILVEAGTRVVIEQILATGIEVSIVDWRGSKMLLSPSALKPAKP